MKRHKTAAEERHLERVAALGCVVCHRIGFGYRPAQIHHLGNGSSLRSHFAVAPLCLEHHDPMRAGTGFHGMGERAFCRLFRVPWECEAGLLVWTNEDLASNREAA